MSDITLPELADYLNREPPILLGCTLHELTTTFVVSLAVVFPVFVAVWAMTDFFVGFIAYMLLLMLCGASGLMFLQRYKNGKPSGHYQTCLLLFTDRLLGKPNVVYVTQRFSGNRCPVLTS